MRSSISSISPWTSSASAVMRAAISATEVTAGGPSGGVSAGAAGSRPAFAATSVLRHLDPALAHRVHDGLGAVVDGQLPQDRAHVVLDGLLGDRQGVGDLLVGHALR